MGQIKWYKRDPERALHGMQMLTLEERGAYNTVLDLIYHRDGNLPDDDRFLAGYLGVDLRVWRRIKLRLMGLGKLEILDGKIRNEMADEVVLEALARVVAARDAGKASASKRAGKSPTGNNENSDLGSTGVGTGASTGVPTNKSKSKIEPNGSIPPTPHHVRMRDWPEIPDWIPPEAWNGFIDMRKRKGGTPTARAIELILSKLDRWRTSGQDPGAVLDQSTEAQWTGIYELKADRNGTGSHDDHDINALHRRIEAGRATQSARKAG